jgi:hypothetical protein
MRMNEQQYREMLIRITRKRAEQIRDGSYTDQPWAPDHKLSRIYIK